MFTDMVGYSALAQRDEKLALELLAEHHRLLRPIFPRFSGREIKSTGDGFLVQFGSAPRPLDLSVGVGTLALTNTTGTSFLFGNFTNSGAATLSIQLGSTSNIFVVSGAAALGGTLRLNYAAGFSPTLGQQFVLLSAASVSGSFTGLYFSNM